MRKLAILVVCGLVVAHVSLTAQGRPSFAGVWTLVNDRTTPPDAISFFGPQIRIEQTAAALTVFAPVMRFSGNLFNGPASMSSGVLRSTVYQLDGDKHLRPDNASYRATWAEDDLVIMTRDSRTFTIDAATMVMERVIRQAFSLELGDLVIDTLVVADPLPKGPKQDPPIPVRAVYRKLK